MTHGEYLQVLQASAGPILQVARISLDVQS